jgi:hypothetical protein
MAKSWRRLFISNKLFYDSPKGSIKRIVVIKYKRNENMGISKEVQETVIRQLFHSMHEKIDDLMISIDLQVGENHAYLSC